MLSGTFCTAIILSLALISFPIYLHFISSERIGVWFVVATIFSVAQVASLGVGPAVTKLLAEASGREELNAGRELLFTGTALMMAVSALLVGIIATFRLEIIGLFGLHGTAFELASHLLIPAACVTAYFFLTDFLASALAGFGRMDYCNYGKTLAKIIEVVSSTSFLLAGGDVWSLLIGDALGVLSLHIFTVIALNHLNSGRWLRLQYWSTARLRDLLRFGTGVFGCSVPTLMLSPLNKCMIARSSGATLIPAYELAYLASASFRALLDAGVKAIMPEISRLGSTGLTSKSERNKLYRHGLLLIAAIGTPALIIVLCFLKQLLEVWLGSRFSPTMIPTFEILLVAAFLGVLGAPAYYVLMGSGRLKDCVKAQSLFGIGNVLVLILSVCTAHPITPKIAGAGILCGALLSTTYLILKHRSIFAETAGEGLPLANVLESSITTGIPNRG